MGYLPKSKGFTFVELLIVSTLALFLLAFSTPFIISLRGDVHMSQRLKQIKSDLVQTMSYSVAGKSIAALISSSGPSPDLVPSSYGLFFVKDSATSAPLNYHYLELKTEWLSKANQPTKSLLKIDKEPSNSTVFIRGIRLIDDLNVAQSVDSALILFQSPFGKTSFFNGASIISLASDPNYVFNLVDLINSGQYQRIEIDLQFKDSLTKVHTITFDQNKVVNVL